MELCLRRLRQPGSVSDVAAQAVHEILHILCLLFNLLHLLFPAVQADPALDLSGQGIQRILKPAQAVIEAVQLILGVLHGIVNGVEIGVDICHSALSRVQIGDQARGLLRYGREIRNGLCGKGLDLLPVCADAGPGLLKLCNAL